LIIGIGNDILEISRVDLKLAERILTDNEKKNKDKIDQQYLAGRFSLKESYFKALGTGISGHSFKDISFLNRQDGSLYIKIHNYTPSKFGTYNFLHATLSHDKFTFATTIVEREEGEVFIGIGTNLGNRQKNIENAIVELEKIARILKVSSVIETRAYGKTDQPDFLNCVVEIDTNLTPDELLKVLLKIEEKLGRVRKERWGPRIIDLDILFYGNLIIESETLLVPHYDFENRTFFIEPMKEISPDFVHPLLRKHMKNF
jgi:2-amino-4-hydroxy-6-hydroxymethyldihydropteridine diphosphokinase